jgi:PilZ domain
MTTRLSPSLANTVDQLHRVDSAGRNDNRRTCDRFACDLPIHCHPIGFPEGFRLQVRLRNISRAGANLTLDRGFPTGTILRLELPASPAVAGNQSEPSGTAPPDIANAAQTPCSSAMPARTTVLACVVHAAQQASGEWQLGCTFINQLRPDDLIPFGARVERPSGPEQRRWVRFPCNFDIRYRVIEGVEGVARNAAVLDISASGIGLATPQPVPGGTLLSLELSVAQGRSPFRILACVVRTGHQQDGRWMLGCNFIRQLQESELQQILHREEICSQ